MKEEFSYEKINKQQQIDEDLITSLVPKISQLLEGINIDIAVNTIFHCLIAVLPQIPCDVRQKLVAHLHHIVKNMGDKESYSITEFSKFIDDVDFSKKI